ncbi:purine/pyrimidine permease [Psychrobacillus antarcticus]|uniref:purine/pyrimidine permease n=1 Tax=Psychrobacillus antarcticus TaxID=2879115 RepID=UPI002407AED6|nr:purine/pyrimidine permease [Psychrobacillus antarcticus]
MQLSGVFFTGMVSSNVNNGKLDIVSFLISVFVFLLILLINIKGKGRIKGYSILLGILIGWTIFVILGKGPDTSIVSSELISLPEVFVWGLPKLNGGMMVTAILFTFLLLSNTFAAITATQEAIPHKEGTFEKRLYAGTWTGGISHILSAMFSTIAVVPLPATAGFVKLTKQYSIFPFIIASLALIAISLFPRIVGILATLPLPVASAALLATLIEMLAIAIRSLRKESFNERNSTIIGVAFLIGIGIMFLPSETFNGLPSIFQHLLSNGLLLGTFVAMILDRLWKNVESTN